MIQEPRIILGICGSSAAVMLPLLVDKLLEFAQVKIVCTAHSLPFIEPKFFEERNVPLYKDEDEWEGKPWEHGKPILHEELRKWANIFLIAPLDANSLAKFATGISDNLLTSIARSWNWHDNYFIMAPSMSAFKWEHPLTVPQLEAVCKFSPTRCFWIASNDKNDSLNLGGMAQLDTIVDFIKNLQ